MTSVVRTFLAVEAAAFYAASLMHSGLVLAGHTHWKAATAESVIGTGLRAGLRVSLVRPGASRTAGLAAQGFALFGTCVGIFTIIVGIGPRTPVDFVLHAGFIALLVTGLARIWRGRELIERHA